MHSQFSEAGATPWFKVIGLPGVDCPMRSSSLNFTMSPEPNKSLKHPPILINLFGERETH